jgi:hypothetical protein
VVVPKPNETTNSKFLTEIQELIKEKDTNISLFIYDPTWKETYNNEQNRYSHFFSVHLALQACNTPYAIKMRSDEFYSNLSPLIQAIEENKTKLTTTEVFFRNADFPFHPSDHLVGGNTQTMIEAFGTAKLLCENNLTPISAHLLKYTKEKNEPLISKVHRDKGWLAAEQHLGLGTVISQCAPNKLKEPEHVSLMKEVFHIVSLKELGLFRVMMNSAKGGPVEYFDTSFFNEEMDINNIEKYG